jgi:putative membrane protein
MRIAAVLFWLAGAGLLALLIATNDVRALEHSLEQLHWRFVLVCAYHLAPLWFDVLGWRRVFLRPPRFSSLLRMRWIGEAANGLLPVPHLGELLRVKQPYDEGADLSDAASSVTADVTAGLATQVMFVGVGLALFGLNRGADTLVRSLATIAVLGWFGAGFYWAQRTHLFSRAVDFAARHIGGPARQLEAAAVRRIEDTLSVVYERRRAFAWAIIWRLLSWVAGAGEIWLVPRLIGMPIGIDDAIVLESLSQGARAVAFIIPGGLGVQDGTLMVLSAQLGLGPELGLVISLVKRLRELALGIPALAFLYGTEMRRFHQRGSIRDTMRAMNGMMRGRNSRGS